MEYKPIIIVLLTTVTIGLILGVAISKYLDSSSARETKAIENTDKDYSNPMYLKKVCIEGHIYYHYSKNNIGTLAPKLTDGGKPVPCEADKMEGR